MWEPENNLVIPVEDRKKNAELDVRPYAMKTPKGLDYLPWSVSATLLYKYNSNLEVGYDEDEHGNPFFVTPFGCYIRAYIFDKVAGKRTPSMVFPCRIDRLKGESSTDWANRHRTDTNMSLIGNDLQRAFAKVIAKEVGFGWSLYSKYDESIDDELDKDTKELHETRPVAAARKSITRAELF